MDLSGANYEMQGDIISCLVVVEIQDSWNIFLAKPKTLFFSCLCFDGLVDNDRQYNSD